MTAFPRRFTLRTLLVAVAVIAVGLAVDRVYQKWYVRNYAGYYVSEVAHVRVRDGDTFDQTQRYFDSWQAIEDSGPQWDDIASVWTNHGWQIEPGDELYHFVVSRHGVYLQFRQGRVVNADSGHDLAELARMNRYPMPPIWLRHGFWPLYLIVVGLIAAALSFVKMRLRRRQCDTAHIPYDNSGGNV